MSFLKKKEVYVMNKKKKQPNCEYCANLIVVGEGSYICYECGIPIMPISNYVPTEEYLKCGGCKYEED